MEKLNYKEIGEGIIEETIGFNQDKYRYVNIHSYSKNTVLNIATEFIENHPNECVDYIKWCFALIDDCCEKTYDIMFDIVNKYTLKENKNFYWNSYEETFVPSNLLEDIFEALKNEETELSKAELKNDNGKYISIFLKNEEYRIFNNDTQYFVQKGNNEPYCCNSTENAIDYLYETTNEKVYYERKVNKLLNDYQCVGEHILEYELQCLNIDESIYWINKRELSTETIKLIGQDFVASNKEEVKEWCKYLVGEIDDCPYILDIVKPIIEKHVLNLNKETYYWNDKFKQIMPRTVISEIEKLLSINQISFTHKVDNGEYTEVNLHQNLNIKIYGYHYSKDWTYAIEINKDGLSFYKSNLSKQDIIHCISKHRDKINNAI